MSRALYLSLLALAGAALWLVSGRARAAAPATRSVTDELVFFAEDIMSGLGGWAPPSRAEPYLPEIYAAEARYGLPHNLLARLLYQESRFRPDVISGETRSPAGALGIAQFMPATARDEGVDPLNPAEAIPGAARYLKRLYNALGSWPLALAAYNWGIGNVQRRGLTFAPEETRNYVAQIAGDVGLA